MALPLPKLPHDPKEIKVQVALGSLDDAMLLRVIKRRNTSGEILTRLYRSGTLSYMAMKALTKHTNVPTKVLQEIYEDSELCTGEKWAECHKRGSSYFHPVTMILDHPRLPLACLTQVLQTIHNLDIKNMGRVSGDAIKNPQTPPSYLRILSTHTAAIVRNAVAMHPSTPPEILKELAKDTGDVRGSWHNPQASVAGNPITPSRTLIKLSLSSKAAIRKIVAQNKSTPVSTLKQLVFNEKASSVIVASMLTLLDLNRITIADD